MTDSLIEIIRKEAAESPTGDDYERGCNAGMRRAIAIIRQHEADMGGARSSDQTTVAPLPQSEISVVDKIRGIKSPFNDSYILRQDALNVVASHVKGTATDTRCSDCPCRYGIHCEKPKQAGYPTICRFCQGLDGRHYQDCAASKPEPVSVSLNKAYEKYLDAYSEVVNRDDSSCADAELAGVKAVLYYARIDYVD